MDARKEFNELNAATMTELYNSGLSLARVVQVLGLPYTRQRAEQVIRKWAAKNGVEVRKRIPSERVIKEKSPRVYKYMNPDGSRMSQKEIQRWRFKNDIGYKARLRLSQEKWRLKKKETDPTYRERLSKYHREYYARKREESVS